MPHPEDTDNNQPAVQIGAHILLFGSSSAHVAYLLMASKGASTWMAGWNDSEMLP